MKKKYKFFCFGFGQVAKYLIKKISDSNISFDLITTNTTKTCLKYFNGKKHKSYYLKNNKFDNRLLNDLNTSNKILISISPKNEKDIVLKNFGRNFKKNKFDWVAYLSATNVYGDQKGQWVDENAKLKPTSKRGIARLNAETGWLKYYKDFKIPIQIFRLSGIYSNESNIINRLKMGTLKVVKKKNHFFSRIHVEDIAEILALSLEKKYAGQVFNISDDYPCSNQEIAKYASLLTNTELPKEIEFKNIKENMLKNFYKESKKVDNKKMKKFFNYNLKYATYKEGLKSIKYQNI